MTNTKQILFCFLISLLFASSSLAEIRRLCKVQYETESGLSSSYTMEITFITGFELNQATNSFSYEPYSNYCLIWFAKGEVAILKINMVLMRSSNEFQRRDFRNLFLFQTAAQCTQINSDNEREWTITAKEFLNWIDAREQ